MKKAGSRDERYAGRRDADQCNVDQGFKRPRHEQYSHTSRGPGISDGEISRILLEREHARRMRDYRAADFLRNKLNMHGVRVFDKQGEWSAAGGRRGRIPSPNAANASPATSQAYAKRRNYGSIVADGPPSLGESDAVGEKDRQNRRAPIVAPTSSEHEALSDSADDDNCDSNSNSATAVGAVSLLPQRVPSRPAHAPTLSWRAQKHQRLGGSHRMCEGGHGCASGGGGGSGNLQSRRQGATTHRAHSRGQWARTHRYGSQSALPERGHFRNHDAQINAQGDARGRSRGHKRTHAIANRGIGGAFGQRHAATAAACKPVQRTVCKPLVWESLQQLQVMTAPALPIAATAANANRGVKANADSKATNGASTMLRHDVGTVQARWQKSSSGLGAKLLMKQGWFPGKGLGRNGNGMVEPFSMKHVGFAEQDLGVLVSGAAGATKSRANCAGQEAIPTVAADGRGSSSNALQVEERYALVPMRLEGEGLGFGSSQSGSAGTAAGADAGASAGATTSSGRFLSTGGKSTAFAAASIVPPQLAYSVPVAVLDILFGCVGRDHCDPKGNDRERASPDCSPDGCLPAFLDDVELCVVSALICRAWKCRCLCRPYRHFISFRQDGYTISLVLKIPPDVTRIADGKGSIEAELRQQCSLLSSSQSPTASDSRYAIEVRAYTCEGKDTRPVCLVRGSLWQAADKLLAMKWLLDGEDDSKSAGAHSSAGGSRGLRLVVQLAKVEKWALWRSAFVGNAPPPMLPLAVAPTFTSQVTYVALPAASKRLPPLEHTVLLASLPGSHELQAFVAHKCGLESANWSGSYLEPNDASEMLDRNGSRVRGIMVWASRCQDSAEAPHQDVSRLAAEGWRKGGIRAVRGDVVLLMVRTKPMDMLESLTLKEYRRMFGTHGK